MMMVVMMVRVMEEVVHKMAHTVVVAVMAVVMKQPVQKVPRMMSPTMQRMGSMVSPVVRMNVVVEEMPDSRISVMEEVIDVVRRVLPPVFGMMEPVVRGVKRVFEGLDIDVQIKPDVSAGNLQAELAADP